MTLVRTTLARAGAGAARLRDSRAAQWCLETAVPRIVGVWRRVWGVAGPILSIPSAFGWAVLAAAVVALVLGAVFGWLELTTIGFVGLVVLLVAVGFVVGRSSFRVDLDLALTRVVVGERAVGRIAVTNTGARSTLPARIELPVGASFASFHLPRLEPNGQHDDLFGIPTTRRSIITVGPVRSVRGDALGLLRREVRWTDPQELFVHPRTISIEGSSSGFLRDLEGIASKDLANDDVSFHALREYVPGDDRRYIHWKTSARTGTLMVRQYEETRRSHLAIALSTSSSDYLDPEEFELAVSTCGSLGLQALREERDLTVLVPGRALHTETGRRLLDDLSGVELTSSRQSIVQLAKATGNAVPNASVAVLVFGADVTATELQAASVHLPLGVRAIAVSCVPGQTVSRRQIGDLVLLSIGELAELPPALRRVNAA
ncbi:DUF58 domain-containing protein [Cnuibacter physcomitrellae]|uniref:DUF58 domain-containing protein n=1 Tax=Cnuibacter physcomitrellae TaxID=1619308 RepID=UPI002175834E|nr:DUF58 domain-containing protein [Cnuibacter physcomitrellae]MCS5498147.1 DUF58 domain-containing protein [Cnuibacter physcomitrellae]